jgi:signal transduction histidine kinase
VSSRVAYDLLTRFVRGLNHEMRTPLSVVSNELFVLRAEGADVRIALEKVKQIDELLSATQHLLGPGGETSQLDLPSLLDEALQERKATLSCQSTLEWSGDAALLTKAFQEFFRIAEELSLFTESVVVVTEAGVHVPIDVVWPTESDSEHPLLSRCLAPLSSFDGAVLPVIDAILDHHGIDLSRSERQGILFTQRSAS